MSPYARCERLWRDVGDNSPWYEKALFHALGALEHGDDPNEALRKIEAALAERPQELDPSIYEREATAILASDALAGLVAAVDMPDADPEYDAGAWAAKNDAVRTALDSARGLLAGSSDYVPVRLNRDRDPLSLASPRKDPNDA